MSRSVFRNRRGFQDFNVSIEDGQRISEIIDGIICIHYRQKNNVEVCNITTQEVARLPGINCCCEDAFSKFYEPYYSLGFNPLTNQYIVLKFCSIKAHNCHGHTRKAALECDIFTLGGLSNTWRKIDSPPPHCSIPQSGSICVNGTIYWQSSGFPISLLAFQLKDEKFQIIQAPQDASRIKMIKHPTGHLALVGELHGQTKKLCMWKLMDHHRQIWAPREEMFVPLYFPCERPVGTLGEGNVYLGHHSSPDFKLSAYHIDVNKKKIYEIDIPGQHPIIAAISDIVRNHDDIVITNHTETLFAIR
ncbi:hypothetical protein Tsubulata_020197 [Turnera subulata]|uniref:F-box associated beta-propeller type 3 domain-containing protein n=1 Tax=Turnera subulata TaxID=218843 RepID=A0A9Q0JB01_9ROSI|nr:hypothetical protein Tsubulata_020197 [Turnera subulata]